MKRESLRLLARWALITTSLSVLLFLAAGTTHLVSIRHFLIFFATLLLVTMLAVDPRLARERAHPEGTGADDGLRSAAGFLFLLTLTFAALSVGRVRHSFNVPTKLREAALVAFALSGSLQTWTMIVNPFFSPVVRMQTERSHYVIQRGPYRLMRHPGYLAMSISVPASALAIGSWMALIPAIAFVFVIRCRVRLEDEFLKRNLLGYADYADNVPGMLIPARRTVRSPYVSQIS